MKTNKKRKIKIQGGGYLCSMSSIRDSAIIFDLAQAFQEALHVITKKHIMPNIKIR